jgi:Luciferase-like monooxygenase
MGQQQTHALQQKASYSITSSARASKEGGTVRPSALAVLRLITNSNLVGCSTGRSEGLVSQSGRKRENFEISGGGFIVTGPDEASLAQSRERVRQQIGFYGSTPAYQPVLELHGLGDLAKKLNKLVRNGDWEKLAAQIPDDVLDLFAAVGTFDELPDKVAALRSASVSLVGAPSTKLQLVSNKV